MFVTAALAHGSATAESVGVGGPFILLIVAAAVVSLLVANKNGGCTPRPNRPTAMRPVGPMQPDWPRFAAGKFLNR